MKVLKPETRRTQRGSLLIEAMTASLVAVVTISAVMSLGSEIEEVRFSAFQRAAFAAEALSEADRILKNLENSGLSGRPDWRDTVNIGGHPCTISVSMGDDAAPGLSIPGYVRAEVKVSSSAERNCISRTRLIRNRFEVSMAGLGGAK